MSSSFLKKSLELADSQVTVKEHSDHKGSYSQLKFTDKAKQKKKLRGAGDVQKKNIDKVNKFRKEHKRLHNKKLIKHKVEVLHKSANRQVLNKILELIKAPGFEAKEVAKGEERTAFTEEDFVKFEKEYFGTGK